MLVHFGTRTGHMRYGLGALLLAVSIATPRARAAAGSLQDADRAFADTLARHDRTAFAESFSRDAECSLPTMKRGRDAIADSWLPFLIDPGTTMILTTTDVTTDPSGDTGTTKGGLAVRGRTNNGIQTVPLGTYVIAWRVIDGRWTIASLTGSLKKGETSENAGGVGPFRFGMTRAAVRAVPDCQPYTDVSVTVGLECAHFQFDGHEMNISFLFAADRLRRIQLWFYEGPSAIAATEAVGRVLAYLRHKADGLVINGSRIEISPEAVIDMVNRTPLSADGLAGMEISTPSTRHPEVWFSRVGRHLDGYMVMLFAEARKGQ